MVESEHTAAEMGNGVRSWDWSPAVPGERPVFCCGHHSPPLPPGLWAWCRAEAQMDMAPHSWALGLNHPLVPQDEYRRLQIFFKLPLLATLPFLNLKNLRINSAVN